MQKMIVYKLLVYKIISNIYLCLKVKADFVKEKVKSCYGGQLKNTARSWIIPEQRPFVFPVPLY